MIKDIRVIFKYGDILVQLPVNPETADVSLSSDNTNTSIVKLGQITQIGLLDLKEISIDSFFPAESVYYANTTGRFEPPDFYISFFQGIMSDRKPVRLIITETEINMQVSIEDFDVSRRWGTDDVDFSISLKEYREYGVRQVVLKNNGSVSTPVGGSGASTNRPVDKNTVSNYVVKTGDNLWMIAQRLLGNGTRWVEIYNANRNIISNPNLIYAGWVLKIPKR